MERSPMERALSVKSGRALLGCCLAVFWSGAVAFGYPGVMATYWQKTYGVGAGGTGAVITFMLLALAVSMFFSGKFHQKHGTRRCILVATVCNTLGMAALFLADSMAMVYVWAFVMNIGCSFVYGPVLATAQQWLPHRRGLASGLVNLVFGISGAVMVPVWNGMLESSGYDRLNLSLLVCIVVTNMAAMLLAEVPERTKLSPQEREAWLQRLAGGAAGSGKGTAPAGQDCTVGQALHSRAFWTLWLTWAFMGAAGISMISLAGKYALSLGLAGSAILTAFNLTNGFGRIAAGLLTDRIGGETTAVLAFGLTAAAYFLLPHVSGLFPVSLLAALVGFGLGTLFTVTGPIASRRFGLSNFGAIFGIIFTAYGFVGGLVGPALAGFVLDRTGGNYGLVFAYLGVFAAVGTGLMLFLKRQGAR